MKFYFFHLMPFPHIPKDLDNHKAVWVNFSNSYYDPQLGQTLYNNYLDQLAFSEEMGFDGVCVNEHHQSAYGTMPSPNIMAAMLAQRTKKVQIAILGNAISLRQNPLRVAEEIAMMDVVTGGRIISGFVRGIGCEYHVFNINPTTSRDRFHEAHDLIIRAWTEHGPFSHHGKYFNYNYVNLWPRPFQQPHPPVWIPSQGSGETIEWAAEKRYTYLQTYTPAENVKLFFDDYREKAEEFGYAAPSSQLGWALPIYVAETDEKAYEESKDHLEFFFNKLLNFPPEYILPPGYSSPESMRKVRERKGYMARASLTAKDMIERGLVIVGSPKTVVDRLKEYHSKLQFGHLIGTLHFAGLPHENTLKNIELFGKEVIPHLRHLDAVPSVELPNKV